jgi:hypothetical protein
MGETPSDPGLDSGEPGVFEWGEDGVYRGESRAGKPHGLGLIEFLDGDRYIGECEMHRLCGLCGALGGP